jgi:two-component system LytT family response regulator
MIRAICIDDEQLARESIIDLIKLSQLEIEVVAQADGVQSGIEVIEKYKPELVFLDIQLIDGSGFDLLKRLKKIDFKLIFSTAYEEFAIRAFKFSAIDYLLKPLNPEDFIHAVKKVEVLQQKELKQKHLEVLLSHLDSQDSKKKKLVLRTSESIHLIDIQDILRCHANSGYTEFYMKNEKKILVSKGLAEYVNLLSDCGFVRTHQSHLVNINFIQSYEKTEGGYILMQDGTHIPVSNRKKENIIRLFDQL